MGSGTRPAAPKDQRTESAYLLGAICPALGKGAGLVMPRCTTEAMNHHLFEIAKAVAPRAHAVILLDQAGWHLTKTLVVPDNLTLMPLPARSPELNPVEAVWQFLSQSWLGNRIFASDSHIVDHGCHAWNRFIDEPWHIMSIGQRARAH